MGLRGESYCILNQRYSRKAYFQVVQALKKKLEEQGVGLLAELDLAARGRWKGGEPRGEFKLEGGVVRGTVIDEGLELAPSEVTAEVADDDDPWLDVVPARVVGSD